jgi:general secretion pathway protein A
MYKSYWQLTDKPFDATHDARFYYPSEVHQGALLKVRYGVESRRGGVLLTGGAGLGKTLLVDLLRRQLGDSVGPFSRLVFPQMPPDQLLAYLADELEGAPTASPAADIHHSVRRIEHTLVENTRRGRHAVVVLDEAHLFNRAETFEAIRLLLNFELDGTPTLTLILVGQPALLPMLERMPALEQRLGVKCLLRPFSLEETISYVAHRVQAAGAKQVMFDTQALEAVHHLTSGCPRRINRLCDLALLIAFAEQQPVLTAAHLEGVSQELLTVTPE